jgi:hypothetical protein
MVTWVLERLIIPAQKEGRIRNCPCSGIEGREITIDPEKENYSKTGRVKENAHSWAREGRGQKSFSEPCHRKGKFSSFERSSLCSFGI